MGAGLGAHPAFRRPAISAAMERPRARSAPLTHGLGSVLCLPAAVAIIMIAIGQWDGPLCALALVLAPALYLIERLA